MVGIICCTKVVKKIGRSQPRDKSSSGSQTPTRSEASVADDSSSTSWGSNSKILPPKLCITGLPAPSPSNAGLRLQISALDFPPPRAHNPWVQQILVPQPNAFSPWVQPPQPIYYSACAQPPPSSQLNRISSWAQPPLSLQSDLYSPWVQPLSSPPADFNSSWAQPPLSVQPNINSPWSQVPPSLQLVSPSPWGVQFFPDSNRPRQLPSCPSIFCLLMDCAIDVPHEHTKEQYRSEFGRIPYLECRLNGKCIIWEDPEIDKIPQRSVAFSDAQGQKEKPLGQGEIVESMIRCRIDNVDDVSATLPKVFGHSGRRMRKLHFRKTGEWLEMSASKLAAPGTETKANAEADKPAVKRRGSVANFGYVGLERERKLADKQQSL